MLLPAFVPLAVERLTFKAVLTNEAPVKIVSITLSTRLPICEAVEVTPSEYDVIHLHLWSGSNGIVDGTWLVDGVKLGMGRLQQAQEIYLTYVQV